MIRFVLSGQSHKSFEPVNVRVRLNRPSLSSGGLLQLNLVGGIARAAGDSVVDCMGLATAPTDMQPATPLYFQLRYSWSPAAALRFIPQTGTIIDLAALLEVADPSAGQVQVKVEVWEGTSPSDEDTISIAIAPVEVTLRATVASLTMHVGDAIAPCVDMQPVPPGGVLPFGNGVSLERDHLAAYYASMTAANATPVMSAFVTGPAGFAASPQAFKEQQQLAQLAISFVTGRPPPKDVEEFNSLGKSSYPPDAQLRWKFGKEKPVLAGGVGPYDKMPPMLHARRPNERQPRDSVFILPFPLPPNPRYKAPGRDFFPLVVLPVEVKAATLEMTLTAAPEDAGAADAHGVRPLKLEYNWLEAEQKLVGSFALEVRRPAALGGRVLYHSDWDDAVLDMEFTDKVITISRLAVIDKQTQATSWVAPFGIRLELRDAGPPGASVARFWLPVSEQGLFQTFASSQPGGGKLQVRRSLKQIIRATGDGDAELIVTLLPPARQELMIDEYDMPPKPAALRITVPPPLEAALGTWDDEMFSGLDISAEGSAHEVIHNSGTVTGSVKNRNPQPDTRMERVTLEVVGSTGSIGPLGIEGPGPPFSREISGLEVGENDVILSAWKPINQVIHGGPWLATARLVGVLPLAGGVLFPRALPAGNIVLVRSVNGIAFSYGRATSAALMDGLDGISPMQPPSFDPVSRTLAAAALPARTGTHELQVVAMNDFGVVQGPALVLNAPRPIVNISADTSAVPHQPGRPFNVGNSVNSVPGTFDHQFALRVEFSTNGAAPRISTRTEARALTRDTTRLTFPESGTLPVGGDARFRLEGFNEFDSADITLNLNRRAFIYDFTAELEMRVVDANAHLEIVEVVPNGIAGLTIGPAAGGFDRIISAASPTSPVGIELIRFKIVPNDDVDEEDRDEVDLDYRIRYVSPAPIPGSGVVPNFGPDYEPYAAFLVIDASRVMEDESLRFDLSVIAEGQSVPDPEDCWIRARVLNGIDREQDGQFAVALLRV
ncbi:MAG: hypothetical protein K1X78_25520 [Verrucomicrobiaceae bacterium]|nr:hypothetical protein [Verrucomicrobiaceae bacterium]